MHICFVFSLTGRLGLSMGAPKQKWNSKEDAALRAGVAKHGVGNWRMILKDPEFSSILRSRSNVDLKVRTAYTYLAVTSTRVNSEIMCCLMLKSRYHLLRKNPDVISSEKNTDIIFSC